MTIAEFAKELERLPQNLDIFEHWPVQGDSENIREFNRDSFWLEDGIGLVIR